jgi:hypothetical protein
VADLTVIVPSRSRPDNAAELAQAFADTCTAATELNFSIDNSDPDPKAYVDAIRSGPRAGPVWVVGADNANMVEALNWAAIDAAKVSFAVGFMGDDHRPRTKGWDERYLEALRDMGTGIVYGNDLLQHEKLPTQCAMTADIIRTLGYMSPPGLVHMYVDDAWLILGRTAGCIRYLPDVVVEHLHPYAGKAEWDDGYRRVNAAAVFSRDRVALARWQATELPDAARKIRTLRGET